PVRAPRERAGDQALRTRGHAPRPDLPERDLLRPGRTRLMLGCGNFGGIGSDPALFGAGENEPEAFAVMDTAWAHGIDWFDTASSYGGGASERAVWHWLAAPPPQR